MARLIFLQSTARSGTTWLGSKLVSHPDVKNLSEFLYPSIFPQGFYSFFRDSIVKNPDLITPKDVRETATRYFNEVSASKEKFVLLDLKLEQLSQEPMLEGAIYSRDDAFFIVLRRLNLLKQVISESIMYQRIEKGDTKVHRNHTPEATKITVKPANIIHRMRIKRDLHDKYIRILRSSAKPYVALNYEDLICGDEERIFSDILSFVGLRQITLKSDLKKQNIDPISDLVTNYDDLKKAIVASEFENTLYLPQ